MLFDDRVFLLDVKRVFAFLTQTLFDDTSPL